MSIFDDPKSKPEPHKYKLSYKIDEIKRNDPGITADRARELAGEGWSTCDAVLIASILFPADGSYSVFFIPKDGRTGEALSDAEMFKVWILLAERLGRSKTLDIARREFATQVGNIFRKIVDENGNSVGYWEVQ